MPKISFTKRREYEQLTVPTISLAIVLILTVFVLVPQFKNGQADRKNISKLKDDLVILIKKDEILANLDAAELNIKADKLYRAIPRDEDLAYFILAIKSMARRSGVEFLGVGLEGRSTSELNQENTGRKVEESSVGLTVSLRGELTLLEQFLFEVEESIPLSVIKDFSFSREEESEGGLSAQLSLDFYYLPDPASLGGVIDPVVVITAGDNQEFDRISNLSEPDLVSLPRVPVGNTNLMY